MPDFLVHTFRWLSGFLHGNPPVAGVLLSVVVFFSGYQHFDVRDSKGGKFFQGLALLILALFGLNAVFSGRWLSLMIVAGTGFVEIWLARRQWRKAEKMTPR
ncbi:MAG: hypothetical protein ABR920_10285 [Terriglobales bacterium]